MRARVEGRKKRAETLSDGEGNCQATKADQGKEIQMKTLSEIINLKAKLPLDQAIAISSWMYCISVQMGVPHRCLFFSVFAQKAECFLW